MAAVRAWLEPSCTMFTSLSGSRPSLPGATLAGAEALADAAGFEAAGWAEALLAGCAALLAGALAGGAPAAPPQAARIIRTKVEPRTIRAALTELPPGRACAEACS